MSIKLKILSYLIFYNMENFLALYNIERKYYDRYEKVRQRAFEG